MTSISNPAAPISAPAIIDPRGEISSPFGASTAPRLPAHDGTQSIVNAVNAAHAAALRSPLTPIR
jgi:hypothetical protein